MRSKDAPSLSVLRAVLADITNSSKTASPITTDPQLLRLVRKRASASEASIEHFKLAKRDDLAEKEARELRVLERYMESLEGQGATNKDDVRKKVEEVVAALKADGKEVSKGSVIQNCMRKGGPFDTTQDDKGQVAKIVNKMFSEPASQS